MTGPKKRHRPSYISSFPPLDEFSEKEEDKEKIRVGADARPSKLVTLRITPTKLSYAEAQDTTTGEAQKDFKGSIGSHPAAFERTHRKISSGDLVPLANRNPPKSMNLSGSDKIQRSKVRRCKGCIVNREDCDGFRPSCTNCTRTGMQCVYGMACASSSMYVQEMNQQAWALRKGALDGKVHGTFMAVSAETRAKAYGEADPSEGCKTREAIFDQTSLMLDKFKCQEGSIMDVWAREKYSQLNLNWD